LPVVEPLRVTGLAEPTFALAVPEPVAEKYAYAPIAARPAVTNTAMPATHVFVCLLTVAPFLRRRK
jgi:hypothetical protein